jgi:hypothetical protein
MSVWDESFFLQIKKKPIEQNAQLSLFERQPINPRAMSLRLG